MNWIQKLRDSHKDFDKGELAANFGENPFDEFIKWFDEASIKKELEPNACSVSTVSPDSLEVSSRIVYLKELKDFKFIFYTNYSSQKGFDLEKNPKAALLFFWPGLERQIRIQGFVEKVSDLESDTYFESRPRESQLSAWASHQSEKLSNREELVLRLEALNTKYPEKVPRPPHWGGYALSPNLIEFWQGRPSRLHDRCCFELIDNKWINYRKNP